MKKDRLNTELVKAVYDENVELAALLIENGANVNTKIGDNNSNLLILAASLSNSEMMELLLDNGATMHAADSDGDFAIHYCAADGYLEGVELLMSRKCLAHIGNKNMFTPMMYAAGNGNLEVVRYFLEHGVPMRYAVDKYEKSELTLACEKGYTDIVKLLLDSGDPKINRSAEINHAFKSAIINGEIDVARILLQYGAKANIKTKRGNPIIFAPIHQEDPDLLSLLVSNGADVNDRDEYGYTPLIKAIMVRREDLAKILIEAGADIYATKSITALSIAKELGDEALLNVITDAIDSKCNTKGCEF
ncbi:unnamed protein product [Hymenolepis diminuta]|uniref:Uncharacterized protein n=2 Tax=Hymenolepis diminuta TaxID=6216 RepID=A0A564Z7U5_HYMDI|nr:unnamed protein product [Hymenolepis diminuta]